MADETKYIWIEEAAIKYKRSSAWLYKQIADGKLTRYTFPGDRRVYLLIEELENYLKTPE